jgi:hypothetical protein
MPPLFRGRVVPLGLLALAQIAQGVEGGQWRNLRLLRHARLRFRFL